MNPDQRHTVGNLQPLCEVGLISVPLTRAKFVEGSVWSVLHALEPHGWLWLFCEWSAVL